MKLTGAGYEVNSTSIYLILASHKLGQSKLQREHFYTCLVLPAVERTFLIITGSELLGSIKSKLIELLVVMPKLVNCKLKISESTFHLVDQLKNAVLKYNYTLEILWLVLLA